MIFNVYENLKERLEEVDYRTFYRDIFPVGSFEEKGVYVDGKYNGIAVSVGKKEKKTKRFTVTDDLEVLDELVATDDFCLMSPISYAGKSRKSENARYLYALTIDLDGIDNRKYFNNLFWQIENNEQLMGFYWGIPTPTYLVSSGTGIHIYYVFKDPLPLFPNVVQELEKLKRRLTWQAWTQGSSSLQKNVQYESLFQGFRVVGTITKKGARCTAFRYGEGKKVDLEFLNHFVPNHSQYRAEDLSYTTKLPFERAKELYPEWYQKRIVEKRPRGSWTCKKDLYDWWIRETVEKANPGHRYWSVMALATYAKKCGVDRKTLEKDAYELVPILNAKGSEDAPFTEDDVLHALEAYTDSYINYPIKTIESRTGIRIDKNKRNFRNQELHLKIARAAQLLINRAEDTDWRYHGGAPKKKKIVQEWQKKNPQGRKIDCEKETGLSRHTVLKWWDSPISQKD